MGQQQSNEKYNRRLSDSDGQYVYFSSSDIIDNVNDNVKGKGKNINFMVPPKAKNNDKSLRINDLLDDSKSKSQKDDQSTSKRNQLDFIDTSKTIDFENFSDNINTPSRNIPIPRVHMRNENHHSSLVNSNIENNNNNGHLDYSVTVIHSSLPTSSINTYQHLLKNRQSHYEIFNESNTSNTSDNNGDDENDSHSSSHSLNNNHESVTHHWRSASEGNSNYRNRMSNEMNDFPGPTNDRQDSRILIMQDAQTSEINLSINESNEANNNNNNSNNSNNNNINNNYNNFITLRTRNNNGDRETTFIYQNNNPSSSSRNTPVPVPEASSSRSNNHRRYNTTTASTSSTSENKKNKNSKSSIKNKYKETTSVSLSYQNLSILPNYVFELKNLVYLDVTHNTLRELPLKLFKLKSLKKLACSDNLIEQIPDEIENLKKLTWLDFTHNRLQSIPDSIGNLTELVGLGLSDCRLTKLPYSIKNLKNLTKLGVFNNNLTWIPPEIGCLESLIKLDLSSNKLQKIPTEIKFLKNLQWLNLSDNKLKDLPVEMNELKNLKELGLGHNMLRYIPDLSKLRKLTMLPIYSNQLEFIGNWICNMKNLEKLDLSDNRLNFIPPGVFKLPKLNYLNIKNNQLRHIACDFALYSSFSQIDLTNSLELIKDEIIDKNIIVYPYLNNLPLSKLEFLDISQNHLSYIPAILTKLTLSTMKYKRNDFKSLFKQNSTDFNIKIRPNFSPKIPVIKCKEAALVDVSSKQNVCITPGLTVPMTKLDVNQKPAMSFFDEILLAEQKKNNKTIVEPLPPPSRTMEIIVSSKDTVSKTFSNNEYIQIIPSKSFPSLASLCINQLFKKYSRKCNARLCKFRNDHINSTYSFVKLCDTMSNSNINQSISSSEESIYYSKIVTPKDLKYLGSINELNITLGQGYYEFLKQSDLNYLSQKLRYLNSKEEDNDRYIDRYADISVPYSRPQSIPNVNKSSTSGSSSSSKRVSVDNSKAVTAQDTLVASPSDSPPPSSIGNDMSTTTLLPSKSKKGKQTTSITKFRHFIGRSSTKNEKEKNKEKEKKSNNVKNKKKDKNNLFEERVREEEAIPPIYNNGLVAKPTKAKVSYQDINSIQESMNINLSLSSFPGSYNSIYSGSTSISNSSNYINKSTINCIHALYSIIKTLPEFTQYAFKHALICDVCGNNYVTNESLKYFRSQYHQSIRSLAKKTINPSPYQQESEEHLNNIDEQDIQNIIQDYGSLRILHWKNQQTEQLNIDGDEVNQSMTQLNHVSTNTTNNHYTIALDPTVIEIDGSSSSSLSSSSTSSISSSSSVSLQTMHDDLNTKTFENLIPFNYRICSHSCMIKLINYLNLHYD